MDETAGQYEGNSFINDTSVKKAEQTTKIYRYK